MRRLAHWSYLHRRLVLAGWVGVLVLTFFVGSTAGSNYANGTKLSGTESATAQNLLQQAAPSVSGDTEPDRLRDQTRADHPAGGSHRRRRDPGQGRTSARRNG